VLSAGELLTVVREGIDLVVVVFNDGRLNLIRRQQVATGYESGVTLRNLDYSALAEAVGCSHFPVAGDLESLVRKIIATPGVRLVELRRPTRRPSTCTNFAAPSVTACSQYRSHEDGAIRLEGFDRSTAGGYAKPTGQVWSRVCRGCVGGRAEGANVRQTGPPTAGGSCASMLRGFFKSRSPAAPDPHTNREKVAHLQAQGITKPQAVAMLANRSELLDSRTLHAMTHFLDLKSMDVGAMQRTAHLTESPAALEALLQITGQIVDTPTSAPFLQDRRVSDHY
jgi:hypothetical protein